MRRLARLLLALAVFAVAWAAQPAPSAGADPKPDKSDAIADEYKRRFDALKPDDVEGHFQLAQWCNENEAWELLRRQAAHVRLLDPKHEQAKLLLELAKRNMGAAPAPAGERTATGGPSPRRNERLPRLLTEEEMQRIRWLEFDDQGEPKPLAVQFANSVIDRFLAAVEGENGFTSEDDKRSFRTLTPNEKIKEIRQETGDRFAADIVIKSDPRRVAEFERKVLPIVLSGCATSGCHGSASSNPLALYDDAIRTKPMVYTNFLILHDYAADEKRMIDREAPERSLLLTYGLLELSPNLDPSFKHPTEIKPYYRSAGDPRYRTIYEWIDSLSAIRPEYGVTLELRAAGP